MLWDLGEMSGRGGCGSIIPPVIRLSLPPSSYDISNNKKGSTQAEGVVPTLSIGTYLRGSCLNTVVAV